MQIRATPALLIAIAAILATSRFVSASDFALRCSEMPDGIAKIRYCLHNVSGLSPDDLLVAYSEVAKTYFMKFKDIDKAIEFQARAAKAANSIRPPKIINGADIFEAHLTRLLFFTSRSHAYEMLAELEDIKSLTLDEHDDLRQGAKYAAAARLHATKAIVIYLNNHAAYALRAGINGRYCKRDDAETDKQISIDLAQRAHDPDAVSKYELIETDYCFSDHRGLLD